ncbi:Adenylate kinase 7 [Anabarilius grahami]|uniref:Adenylate kinase 7 n=1 Tax=Anabarilius grahami TaxID=495550 RepID=A0A3N0XVE1_ANAGA|nr:Adenylate kinase 7 [Anabarilius grahami]
MADKTEKRPPNARLVFINNVDQYATKNIAKFLDSCVVGASLVAFGEADVEEEDDRIQDEQPKIKDATFQIVGTVSSQTEEKCSFISEEYSHLKREELLQHLMKCDVIIYDITQHPDQIDEAQWAVSALHEEIDTFSGHKMFILVSTIMTWATTKPVDKDDPDIPFTDEHYRKRKAHPNFHDHISLEKLVVKLGKTQTDIDSLLVSLRIEALYVKENFNIHWVSEDGMVENIEQITEEYKQTRGLLPLRICILGPPAVGKSTIAERICKHYKLHHVKLKETITETLDNLELCVHTEDVENDEGETQEFLDTLKENMNENEGLEKQFSVCSPEFMFSVDATDDFLKNRVLNLPETVVEGTSYTPEQFLHRLARFRERNVEDQTVLNYFEDLEIHPENLDITSNDDSEYLLVTEKICKKIGKPKNYGLISEEVEEEEQRQAEQQLKEQAAQRAEAERREEEEAQQRDQRWGEWNQHLEEVRRQEHDLLESQSGHFRNYLMRDVMPTLTQGLIECCTIRPDDPIDFLVGWSS